jgi:SAM-dependent methyltransferase
VSDDEAMAARAIAAQVSEFYERHPYPPPVDDLDAYVRAWDDRRRRAESHLFWPDQAYRDDRSILVAGCGTAQAARCAARWPRARVMGIDVSETSVAFERELKRKHGLENLELGLLPVERVSELQARFNQVICTGVLHHLVDPDAGLLALRDVLEPDGAMHLMVYAPYGRIGVYMLQEYCRRLSIGATGQEIHDLVSSLDALPADHPIVPLLRKSPDFASDAGVADALLHPNDRAYSVPQLIELVERAGLVFGRWLRQAPYLPWCGAPSATPHASRLQRLAAVDQYAAMELFRGTMARHSAVLYRADKPTRAVDFGDDAWLAYVPIRLPDTIAVRDRLPPGASAVLINRSHAYTDLYLPIDARQERLLEAIDGRRSIGEMGQIAVDRTAARGFFEQLWRWDQIVFDTSTARASSATRAQSKQG